MRDLTTAGRRRNKLLALALGAMPLCLCSTAWADRYWVDSVTAGSWSNGANWNSTSATGSGGAGAPGSSDNVYLQNTTSSAYTVALDESDTISTLQIGDAGGGTDTLSQTGTFNFSMATEQVAAASNSVGVHTQSAGTNTYSGVLYVGYGLKSVGTYNLSGTGAIGLSGGASTIDVGYSGSGSFNQDAGTMQISTTFSVAGLFLGVKTGSSGSYSLSGTGIINDASFERVGDMGIGTFSQTGGTNYAGGLIISDLNGASTTSTYSLSGAGSLVVAAGEVVGNIGVGIFNQSGGSSVVSGAANLPLWIGGSPGGHGTYNLSNTGSLTITCSADVGYEGAGTFNQTGGVCTVGAAASPQSLNLAYSSGSDGTSSLTGTGSLTVNGSVYVGGSSSGVGGTGTFSVSGGTMSVTSGILVYSGSNFTQSGGSVTAGSMTINSGGTLNLSGGTLSAPVSVAGTLATAGSPNTASLTNSLTLQSTATTLAQLVGSTPSFLDVQCSGNIALAGSLELYVDAANEAGTTAGQSFIILQTTGSGALSGAFANITSGQVLTTTDGTGSFVVTINSGVDGDVVLSDFQMVPEPGVAGVMGAVAAMGMMRRRRELKVKN